MQKQLHGVGIAFSTNGPGAVAHPQAKISSNQITDLNIKGKMTNFLGKKK